MPDTTPTTTTDSTVSVQPVTNQPAPESQPRSGAPTLEATHASETFAELNKLFDSHPDAPKTTPVSTSSVSTDTTSTQPAQAPDTSVVGADFDKKLDTFKAPEGAHPNVSKGMDDLKAIAREAQTRATQFEKEITELKTKVTGYEEKIKQGVLPEPVQKELEDLRTMRREMDIRLDPEFQKTYVSPIQESDESILQILQSAGCNEKVMQYIFDHGGLLRMAQSQEPANDKQTIQQWVEDTLIPKLPGFARNRVTGHLTAGMERIDKMNKYLADFQGASKQRWEDRMKKMTQEFNEGKDAAIAALGDLAKPRTITNDMSPEQRQEIEAHNNIIRQGEQQYEHFFKAAQSPKIAGELLVKATQAALMLKLYNDSQKEIAHLKDRITKMTASTSHSNAGFNAPPPGPDKPSMGALLKTDTSTAMDELFRKAGVTQ